LTQYPKQYLPLVADNTMLQETILRLNGLDNLANPIIVCNAEHRALNKIALFASLVFQQKPQLAHSSMTLYNHNPY
jgi:mannose-1-phosphate guanylyltransferase